MTALGMQNSRMKDFFDLWILARDYAFDGQTLVQAVVATFRRRETLPPTETPLALTAEFGTDPIKIEQWVAFVRKGKLAAGPAKLEAVITMLRGFLMALSRAAGTGEAYPATWAPGGPWKMSRE